MMQDFNLYLQTGMRHILSWDALDHLLFILALVSIYTLSQWRQLLVLVTAFTIGHSLTLALSVLDILRINDKLVEVLIPCTIIGTAIFNLTQINIEHKKIRLNYFLALGFGLIHGMGFANTIRFMLAKDQNILLPLFSFNLGLELAQIIVVSLILMSMFIVLNLFKFRRAYWISSISFLAILVSARMIAERWF